jgi:catechol 2,3-dioxygenase-like lactoylglutathione lyase family enzyme
MASRGLLHIALLTRDLKKSEQFYTEILGLKVAFRVPPNMIFLRTPGSQDLINLVGTKKPLSQRHASALRLQDDKSRTHEAGKEVKRNRDRDRRKARQTRNLFLRPQRVHHRVLLRLIQTTLMGVGA